jgi:hypothetical protein
MNLPRRSSVQKEKSSLFLISRAISDDSQV